jgi:ABC-type transporter Mla subunit MlaD
VSDEALPLHSDATAQARPRTFLEGNYFIDLHPGSPSAADLADGGSVPLNQTQGSVRLDQIVGTFRRNTRDALRSTVRGIGSVQDARTTRSLHETFPQLPPLLRNISRVSEALRGTRPGDLAGAIRSSSRVAAAINSRRLQLGPLVHSFSVVAVALADNDAALRAALARLPIVLAETRPALSAVNAALPQTRALLAEVRPGLRAAPPVLDRTIPFTSQLNQLLGPGELPLLVDRATPTVRDLAAVTPKLTSGFHKLRPTASCLLNAVVPTLLSTVPDGALSTNAPAYEDLVHGLVGLTSTSANFDGNGFNLRYEAGFNDEVLSGFLGSPSGGLLALADQPILGSRPAAPSSPPPLKPDVPCTSSGAPDLSAQTAAPDFRPTGYHLRIQAANRGALRRGLDAIAMLAKGRGG